MAYSAFYACYSTEEVVDAADAYEVDLDWAQNIVVDILRDEGDFFGLVDESGTTIQFMCDSESVWVEIPSPKDQGSFGKHIELSEVRGIIASLPPTLSLSAIDGLEFCAW